MMPNQRQYNAALQDFTNARRKASIQEILTRLSGGSSELLSYEEVAKKLKLNVRSEGGVQDIPIKSIIGSLGRYTEFTRDFLPLKNVDQKRWARVKAAFDDPLNPGMPPIEVYKVGEVYFVLDGNHRVSIAREEGFDFISAHVINVRTDVPITPDVRPDDLIIKAEYADFLEKTDLANLRPGMDLSVTVPGQYEKLLEHIQVHRYFMGIDFHRDVSYPDAVVHWYDAVYAPFTQSIHEHGLLRWFPGRTETDIYLWVSAYQADLQSELGWTVKPEAAAEKLAAQENPNVDFSDTGAWRTTKMFDRYIGQLFEDILVPITGMEASWLALEQAILVAQKENAILHGLHVIPAKVKENEEDTRTIRMRFESRCREANLSGSLIVDKGGVVRRVHERALLTDLIVLNVEHPPMPGLSSLRNHLRSIIWESARPILTVTGQVSPMDNAILAYDGSSTSKEALFVATYLAEKWLTKLKVVTIAHAGAQAVQDYARSYLELHELQVDFVGKSGSFDIFLEIIKECQVNLVIMGSYSGTPLKEVIAGSAVNFLLRKSDCSLLICK